MTLARINYQLPLCHLSIFFFFLAFDYSTFQHSGTYCTVLALLTVAQVSQAREAWGTVFTIDVTLQLINLRSESNSIINGQRR